ncbi:MAG: SAM-dependent methyltransferase [Flavobacterium sp. BFFFF2]|nr:MAG: SAM-dependent methyltransferase [Flavobacterium sp. BFFFF2]
MIVSPNKGHLYLIPTFLGPSEISHVFPEWVSHIVCQLTHFVVEQEKTARRFIKAMNPTVVQADLILYPLNKHTEAASIPAMLAACMQGVSVGLMSEAGCPGVADPGAEVVAMAHKLGIRVIPLVGPSSILLALMASGLNGQQFAFHGYLPIDKAEKKHTLKQLERRSIEENQTQLFIETPYRNNALLADLCQMLQPQTRLCVAVDISLPTEQIEMHPISVWKSRNMDLHKRPCMFLFLG